MNKNIEMNKAFTLIELIRRYQLETKNFMRYSKNIVNGIEMKYCYFPIHTFNKI